MSRLYAANLAYTTLDLPISDASVSFTVDDPTNFSDDAPFIVKCESEIMLIGAINKVTRTFSSVTRGYEGTVAAAHDADTTISNVITAGYLNTMYTNIEDKLDTSGGTMTGTIVDPVLQNYTEKVVPLAATGSTANLELDLSAGNVFKVTQTGSIVGIDIANASTADSNPITLDILSDASTYYIAWLDPYSVITASTKISASTADNSFNAASTVFAANVLPGDIITVSGFSTGSSGNNANWRVLSRTDTKIIITDDVTTVAAGASVTITRRQEFFKDTDVPDAPTAHIPKVFTLWSYGDPTRWRIAEVGEF